MFKMKKNNSHLVTVTREDLDWGVQSVQSTHAAINFTQKYPAETHQWFTTSNYLWQCACKDEFELEGLAQKAEKLGLKIVRFFEPDINNQLTAIAIEPGEQTRKLVRNLPKMLS